MKLIICIFSTLSLSLCYSSDSDRQTINLIVEEINALSIPTKDLTLIIDNEDTPSATDSSSSYSLTTNSPSTMKITAILNTELHSEAALTVELATSAGSSRPPAKLSSHIAKDLVTNLNVATDSDQTITYVFSVPTSKQVVSGVTDVTFTLTEE